MKKGGFIKLNWLLVLAVLFSFLIPFTNVVPVSANVGYSLVAFGVKLDAGGTTVTEIGWARGNSDKGWREGDWIPAKAIISGITAVGPDSLANLPDIKIGFDFTAGNQSNDPRFIDMVRDIQIGMQDLDDAHGWPQANGDPYPTGMVPPNPPDDLPALAQVHIAQTSAGENYWHGPNSPAYTLLSSLSSWNPSTQVNRQQQHQR